MEHRRTYQNTGDLGPMYVAGSPASHDESDLYALLSHVSDVLCAVAFTVDDERLLALNEEVIAGLMAAGKPVGEEPTDDQNV